MQKYTFIICCLSYDRSIVSSKTSSPQIAIQYFISHFLRVIQKLLTSSSSSFRHSYLSLYISLNNMFQKAVPMQDVTNQVTRPSFYYMQDIPLLLDSWQYFFISNTICPTDILHPFPAPHLKKIALISDLFTKVSQFQHHTKLCSKCSTLPVSS